MPYKLGRLGNYFGINFETRAKELLPYFFGITIPQQNNKNVFINLAYVIFNGLKSTNQELEQLATDITNRLAFSGQILSLEVLLNLNYDPEEERIYIQCFNSNFVGGIDIYTNAEEDPTPIDLYLNKEDTDTPVTIWANADLVDPEASGVDISFTVHVPADVAAIDPVIKKLLNLYVIAPMQYTITRF